MITNFPQLQLFKKDLQTLLSHLKPYKAYLVGGCVRDIKLGHNPKDLDIEVYDILPDQFEELMKKIGVLGVGKSFFVYKWKSFDISLPRKEEKISKGHKGFKVSLCEDEKIASKRRDFSVNSMMINLFTCETIDFHNGQEDIVKKLIRLIDETSFKEDSLRVLRAVQFCARLKFKIEKHTLEIMQTISLDDISPQRIFWEFEKLFLSNNMHFGLYYLCKLNIFKKLLHEEINVVPLSLYKELARAKIDEQLRPFLFIYIVYNRLNLNIKNTLDSIKAPNIYYKMLINVQFFNQNPLDGELEKIAIKTSLKSWLGIYQKNVLQRAKKLDIFDKNYTGNISAHEVIKDGFTGSGISKELYNRRLNNITKNQK